MSTVVEIESALRELPLEDVEQISRWLRNYLIEASAGKAKPKSQPARNTVTGQRAIKLPDYAMRRRMIFGDKVLPNMVTLGREQERW